MSQHDMILDNQSGAAFRADLNLALQALVSLNAGTSAPSTTYAYMPWYDTTTGLLKIRNGANSAWVIIGPLADSTQHVIYTSNLARVTVDSNGKVGIGDTTPSYELDVNGDINATGAIRVGGVALTPGYNFINAGTSANSGDTFTGTPSPAISAYANNQLFLVLLNATNTTTTPTFNFNAQGAKTVKKQIGGAIVAVAPGDLQSGSFALLAYNGTDLILTNPRAYSQGANVASAGTTNLDTASGDYVNVTGTTTITAVTLQQGREVTVVFGGALTLTNGASLILPTGANITTAAGDIAVFRGEASSVARCISYTKAGNVPAATNQNQTFTKAQRGTPVSLTQAATIAVDLSLGNHFYTTMTGNRTLGQPTNMTAGQSGTIEIIQDGTGSRTLAYHADWLFPGGTDPVLSTAAGSKDLLCYQVNQAGDKVYANLLKGFA